MSAAPSGSSGAEQADAGNQRTGAPHILDGKRSLGEDDAVLAQRPADDGGVAVVVGDELGGAVVEVEEGACVGSTRRRRSFVTYELARIPPPLGANRVYGVT
jgi:hypothetical protein